MYKRAIIPLGKGLNFVNAKSMLEPGTLVNCLNYEIVDTGGLRRCDGTLKWDGGQDLGSEVLWAFPGDIQAELALVFVTLEVGDYLYSYEADEGEITYDPAEPSNKVVKPFGVYAGKADDSSESYFFALDPSRIPFGSYRGIYKAEVGINNGIVILGPPYVAKEPTETTENVLDSINDFIDSYSAANNAPVELGPSTATRVLGLHYFDKNGYAIVDCVHELTYTRVSQRVFVGDIICDSAGTTFAMVLYSSLLTGSWTGGTGSDTALVVVQPLERTAPLATDKRLGAGTFGTGAVTDLFFLAKSGSRFTHVLGTVGLELNDKRVATNSSSIWKSFNETGAAELGGIQSITVTNGGSSYDTAPTVSFTAPPAGGVAPIAYCVMTGSAANLSVARVVITDPGRGYNSSTTNPTVTFTGGGGSGAVATVRRTSWQYAGLQPSHNGWIVKVNSNTTKWPSGYLNKVNKGKILGDQPAGSAPGDTAFGTPSKVLTGLDFDTAVQTAISSWSPTGAANLDDSLVQTTDGNGIAAAIRDVWANYDMRTATIGFTGFSQLSNGTTPVPENAIIKGIEVNVTFDTTGTPFSAASITAFQARATLFKTTNSNVEQNARTETRLGNYKDADLTSATHVPSSWTITANATDEYITFGGATDLWGTSFKYSDVWDPNFGLALDFYVNRASTTGTTFDFAMRIDKVELKVYWYAPSSFVYFNDADGNTIKSYLLDYHVAEGSLEAGDAEMYVQLSKLTQVATSTTASSVKYHIGPTRPDNTTSTMSMYVEPGLSAASKVGEVAEDMSYNGLPNYDAMRAADSKAKLVDANFYAADDWAAVYGVTGAGRAFSHDGLFFTTIWAYKPGDTSGDSKDKPRHLAVYKDRLVLGYRAGNVSFSSVGEPNNFQGVSGAVDLGTGAQVTGIQVFQGNYLAVFCDSKILGVTSDFTVTTLSPNSGAIEYTVEAIGNTPVYCNSQGIFTMAQSDKYGDFAGLSLSAAIYPWLRPRLSRNSTCVSGTSPGGIVLSYVCRSKNQYRLWFEDGYQLVMHYAGEESIPPEFTLMRYGLATTLTSDVDLGPPVVTTYSYPYNTNQIAPLCVSSSVDKDGREVMLFYPDYYRYSKDMLRGIDEPGITHVANAPIAGRYWNHIYRIDAFWQVDGGSTVGGNACIPIEANFQVNYWNKENPFLDATIRKARLEGSSRNVGTLAITTDSGYAVPDPEADATEYLYLEDRDATVGVPNEFLPKDDIVSLAETGRLIGIRLDNLDEGFIPSYTDVDTGTTFGPRPLIRQPPHYAQLLLIQFEEGKEDG